LITAWPITLRRLVSDRSSAHERRLIRSELETQLAHAMLVNEVYQGDRVTTRCDSYGTASSRRWGWNRSLRPKVQSRLAAKRRATITTQSR
jgi:hypothetical protein